MVALCTAFSNTSGLAFCITTYSYLCTLFDQCVNTVKRVNNYCLPKWHYHFGPYNGNTLFSVREELNIIEVSGNFQVIKI